MNPGIIILVWVLHFGISFWNAYAVGLAWVEAKHHGRWPRFAAWMGAVMSAAGFSWCYLIILAAAAHGLGWLDIEEVGLALKLGYLLLIPGVLIAGQTITLDSWARAYRARTVANIGRAAWNTYAQIHNTYHAIGSIDDAFGSVVGTFDFGGSGSSSSKSDKKGAVVTFVVVFLLVVAALLSGILTTAVIVCRVAGNDKLSDRGPESDAKPDGGSSPTA